MQRHALTQSVKCHPFVRQPSLHVYNMGMSWGFILEVKVAPLKRIDITHKTENYVTRKYQNLQWVTTKMLNLCTLIKTHYLHRQ